MPELPREDPLATFQHMRITRTLAFATAGFAYALIVLGGVVRITGSGMGCGDDWPLCNGRLIPPIDNIEVAIEWGHRLAALGVSAMVVILALVTLHQWRTRPESAGSVPVVSALLAAVLLVLQVMLGAVTVWLELPAWSVVFHLATAMALLAALQTTGLKAPPVEPAGVVTTTVRRGVLVGLGLGALALVMGALTANLGAGPACTGFPLCSGSIWPLATESGLPHIHWTHRLVGYALLIQLGTLLWLALRSGATPSVTRGLWLANVAVWAQVGVAAVMVMTSLPPVWRALHVALGTALWMALIYLTWLTRSARSADQQPNLTPARAT